MRRRIVTAAVVAAGALGLLAPSASADSTVCNYGNLMENVGKQGPPGATGDFAKFTSPMTQNRNNLNIPRGGVQLLLCQFE
jgi:hypothetical protein